jgi:uncharacterized protein YutE (UPF0331/DUF86 family)
MTEHLRLIARQLDHLQKMQDYLEFSYSRANRILPATQWSNLTPDQHETLAAFRVRFSEFQEHLGKTMRAVAIEEEAEAERFGSILAFMEKLGILDSADNWKFMRELRNAINHEYEDDMTKLNEFFAGLLELTPTIINYFQNLKRFCKETYNL